MRKSYIKRNEKSLVTLFFLSCSQYTWQHVQEFAQLVDEVEYTNGNDESGYSYEENCDSLHCITSIPVYSAVKKDSERLQSNKGTAQFRIDLGFFSDVSLSTQEYSLTDMYQFSVSDISSQQ